MYNFSNKRTYLAALSTLLGALLFSANAAAMPIEVLQGGIKLGEINPYTGTITSSKNWTRNKGAATGPIGTDDLGKIFFYDSAADGLSFNIMWNKDATDKGPKSVAEWDITVDGSGSDPVSRKADDNSKEFSEMATNNLFHGNWAWGRWYDVGIIGELVGYDWEITIDPINYTNILGLQAVDASDKATELKVNTSENIILRPVAAVPEPGTLALLLLGGLAGFAAARRKAQ